MWNMKLYISKYLFALRMRGETVRSCNQNFRILYRAQANTDSVSSAMTWPYSQAFMRQAISEISGSPSETVQDSSCLGCIAPKYRVIHKSLRIRRPWALRSLKTRSQFEKKGKIVLNQPAIYTHPFPPL